MTYDPNNIFAKILRGEIPCHKVYENDHTLAFMDVMPQANGHTLVIPKYAASNIFELPAEPLQQLIGTTQLIATAAQQAFNADGITIMQFNGEAAGQTVFHIHVHVVPRYLNKPMQEHGRSMADQIMLAQQALQLQRTLSKLDVS